MGFKVKGIDNVLLGLNKAIKEIERKTTAGMLEAGVLVRGESQRNTPVDTGNLRASAYLIWGGGGKKPKAKTVSSFKIKKKKAGGKDVVARLKAEHVEKVGRRTSRTNFSDPFVEVGYTAFYAPAVHEATNKNFKVGGAKFLERALRENSSNIFAIIRRRATTL